MSGYIYLIKLREFNNIKEPTYKLGRSSDINRRHKEYPKDSILVYSCIVNNEKKLEPLLMDQFEINFIQKKEYGTEYFKGDYVKMIQLINEIIHEHDDIMIEPETNIIESYHTLKNLVNQLVNDYDQKELISNKYITIIENDNTKTDIDHLNLLNTNINRTILDINELINIKNKSNENIDETEYPCEYEGHCESCIRLNKIKTYCVETCDLCHNFRIEEKKTIKESAKRYYKQFIMKKDNGNILNPIVTNNITINNIHVNCDSLEINIKEPYFISRDNLFYVTIEINRPTIEEMIKQLKYIFTYSMCGSKGKYLFPNEEKHSASGTFEVTAALYTIKNVDTKPILHGLLRYTKSSSTLMTVLKLENIKKSSILTKNPIIKAISIPLWENTKHYYCVKTLQDTIKNITSTTYYGSSIKDFVS